MRPFLYTLFAVSCLSFLLWGRTGETTAKGADAAEGERSAAAMTMPKQCRPGKTSPEANGWRLRQGTQVSVYYLKSDFSETERDALSRAVSNWNEALKEIDSQIVFIVKGENETIARDGTTITVLRGVPVKKERVGEIKLHSRSNGRAHLALTISPVVTDLGALVSLMTHELGHTVGLGDCYGCQRGTTAMSAFKGRNKGNDVYEPSECDKYMVAAGYMEQRSEQEARAVLSGQE